MHKRAHEDDSRKLQGALRDQRGVVHLHLLCSVSAKIGCRTC